MQYNCEEFYSYMFGGNLERDAKEAVANANEKTIEAGLIPATIDTVNAKRELLNYENSCKSPA